MAGNENITKFCSSTIVALAGVRSPRSNLGYPPLIVIPNNEALQDLERLTECLS